MESNESSNMTSHSSIDIVQSLLQDQGYLQEADFLNQADAAATAAAAAKDDEPSQTYVPEEFLNEPVASQVVNLKKDSSKSEFERLLNDDVVADSADIVVGLSNEAVTSLSKTTDGFGIVSKTISDKIVERTGDTIDTDTSESLSLALDDASEASMEVTVVERTEETIDGDTSESLSLALDDASDVSVEVVKGAAEDTLETASEITKQNSAQTTKEQSDTDVEGKKLNKETSDGIIQRANIVNQSSIAKTQRESPEYESGKTNDKGKNGNIAETVTTESLETMLEYLDGPAEPQVTESEGSNSSNSNNIKSILASNTVIIKSRQDLLEETKTSEQDELLIFAVEEDDAPTDVAAASAGVGADSGRNTSSADAPSCQDIDIKIEIESGDEVTYTDTYCEGPYDNDNDAHYFKMFECKVLSIDLHDIIKTESSRDAKAGLYKPSERRSIDIIRKEYKTKEMQDYIIKVKRMKLPDENSTPRSISKNKKSVTPIFAPMCLVYPVKKGILLTSRKPSIKRSSKAQIPKRISQKRNVEGKLKKLIQDDYVYDSFGDDEDIQPSNKKSNKAQIPKRISHKRNDEDIQPSNKKSNKAQIPKRISHKRNDEVRLKKLIQDDFVCDIFGDNYQSSTKTWNKTKIPKGISHKRNGIRFKKLIGDYADDIFDDDDDDDEDYLPSDISANYTCFDCMEGFETNAELKVHKRMEHNESTKKTPWKTLVKAQKKKKRDTIPSYFKSDQFRIDGVNGMKSIMGFKASTDNLNIEDMIQGANLVHNHNTFYNHELGKQVSDQEMYQHMVNKYTIKVAQLCIGANRFSSYYQLAKSPGADSHQKKISTVREDRGHVLISSPLLHW